MLAALVISRRLGHTRRMASPSTAAIDAALPNGFHDAYLRELHVQYANREIRLVFDFWVGPLDAPTEAGREAMRAGVLRLTTVQSMLVEPPDTRPPYALSTDEGVWVDGGFGVYPGDPQPPDDELVRVWLFSQTANAKMLFTAGDCALEW